MAENNSSLAKTEQIQKLINAVQTYAHEVQETGTLLNQASELCKSEMENDDLSVAYAQVLEKLLGELAVNVFPRLEALVDGLIAEKRKLEELREI